MGALLNAFLIAIASANFVATTRTHALAWSFNSFSLTCQQPQRRNNNTTRRKWISESISSIVATASLVVIQHPTSSYAITAEGYDNPNYPSPPEERCEHSFCLSFFVIAKVFLNAVFTNKNDNCFFPMYMQIFDLYKQRVL